MLVGQRTATTQPQMHRRMGGGEERRCRWAGNKIPPRQGGAALTAVRTA